MEFRLGELFCGAGGLACGALRAGQNPPILREDERFTISHAWANDLDESACRTYAANIVLGGGRPSRAEIDAAVTPVASWVRNVRRGVRAHKLPSVICGSVVDLGPHIDDLPRINAFAFGFPCNDFSSVGERRGLDGAFGPLYEYGVQVIARHEPRFFVAENVEGLLHRDQGRVFLQIYDELRQAGPGYVLTAHLYRFQEYGVPQMRTRLVLVGISRPDHEAGVRFGIPRPPLPTEDLWTTAQQALAERPIPARAANHVIKEPKPSVLNRLLHTPPGHNAWSEAIPEEFRLNVKKAHLSQIYRRLEPDRPAYTITGNGGGGTHGYHWAEPRALTNRERARLQSFDDHFVFEGGDDSVRRQIGMAVPPLGAQHIFEAILKSYARVPYETTPAYLGPLTERRLREHLGRQEQQVLLTETAAAA